MKKLLLTLLFCLFVTSAFATSLDEETTVLFSHCDGTDGSTSFVDEVGNTITALGNAQIDTEYKQFGTASALFDGNDDGLLIEHSSDFDFDTDDFTMEAWIRPSSLPDVDPIIFAGKTDLCFMLQIRYNSGTPHLILSVSNGLSSWGSGGFYASMGSATISTNTWYHIAFVRNSGVFKVYVNGTEDISVTQTIDIPNSGGIRVGINEALFSEFVGNMDEIVVTKGVARYTSNFTPETSAYAMGGGLPRLSVMGRGIARGIGRGMR